VKLSRHPKYSFGDSLEKHFFENGICSTQVIVIISRSNRCLGSLKVMIRHRAVLGENLQLFDCFPRWKPACELEHGAPAVIAPRDFIIQLISILWILEQSAFALDCESAPTRNRRPPCKKLSYWVHYGLLTFPPVQHGRVCRVCLLL
jgi:hypothetical protein